MWLGTRNGYLFLLDAAAVEEGREVCHLGLQHCGEGKVRNIVPLVTSGHVSAKLEVRLSHAQSAVMTNYNIRKYTQMHYKASLSLSLSLFLSLSYTHTLSLSLWKVLCSLESPDEVSGSLMMWSYQCQQDWRPKPSRNRCQSAPLPTISTTT